MNVLLLAPHPFYQERGTPIAVDLLLRVLSERGAHVDVVTYHEGKDVTHEHVNVYRIAAIPFVHGLRPGFSWKKLMCDAMMVMKVFVLVSKNRYDVVHAIEESVFIALLLRWFLKIPYVYDMDSLLSLQLQEQYPWVVSIRWLLHRSERLAVKNAAVVAPVCETLAACIAHYQPKKVVQVHDVPLMEPETTIGQGDLKQQLGATGPAIMYVGNLESYQGIDLLLDSFALVVERAKDARLVIIGGEESDIERYRKRSGDLNIQNSVHFLGPKPIRELSFYLSQADVLVSPRIKGNNTPMKLYSYLHSGKAVVATDLPTHTQILHGDMAMLAPPSPEGFSKAILHLIEDETLRERVGRAGKQLIDEKYTYASFCEKLNGLYDWLEQEIGPVKSGVPLSAPLKDKPVAGNGRSALR